MLTMNLDQIMPLFLCNDINNNKANMCQSCKTNAIGFDPNPVQESVSPKELNLIIVKCLDCNHLLCLTCYLAHVTMKYFSNHRVIQITDTSSLNSSKRKFLDLEIEDSPFSKTPKSDWSSAYFSNNSDTCISNPESPLNNFTSNSLNEFELSLEMLQSFRKIENQINKTFEICEKVLTGCRDSLLDELNGYVREFEKQPTHPIDIDFITNSSDIKSYINENFGYISLPTNNHQKFFYQHKHEQISNNKFEKKHNLNTIENIPPNHIKFKFRIKMNMEFKFGGTGLENDHFTEPNGIATDKYNNIIVADSNSNYMKCFEPDGKFRFKFGIEKLLFPNKVTCHKETGNIIIIERKPAHEIKIFNKNGEFLKRFGSGLLKSPRGVYIDRNSRIIILESKVMRILIFSMEGELIKLFDVSQYFRFANSICTSNTEDRIYISDNHSHCIKVFNYNGDYLAEYGGPGLTNYPTSVSVNSKNELIITDNYNCFNLTILSENGDLVRAYESKMKHARILDVSIIDDQKVMFSSRDNFIYTYRF